jgi:hypothetical protein
MRNFKKSIKFKFKPRVWEGARAALKLTLKQGFSTLRIKVKRVNFLKSFETKIY